MVNTLSHLGIGLLIASVAGLERKQRRIVAFLAILPDLDFISDALLIYFGGNFSHQTYVQLYYLFGHREFTHSLLFILIITTVIWFYSRDMRFTLAGLAAIFSHLCLDYSTTWKMRPLYPFSDEPTIMGTFDPFDPVVMFVSLVPIYFLLAGWLRRKGFIRNIPGGQPGFTSPERPGTYRILLLVLILWCAITPVSKAVLLNHVSDMEGYNLNYQSSYPKSFGTFLSAYPYNQTHYRVLEISYWAGIEKSMFVPIISGDAADDHMVYIQLSTELYDSAPVQEIDYTVYDVSTNGETVIVTLQDARNPFAIFWTYFGTEYIFEFDRDNGEYTACAKRGDLHLEEVPDNWFWIPFYSVYMSFFF